MKKGMCWTISATVPIFLCMGALATNFVANAALAADLALPTEDELISNLDLTCHKVDGELRPPVEELTIRHLNPVLQDLGFKEEKIELHEMNQLCVPVAKNQVKPPSPAYEYIEWIDLACYQARSNTSQQADLFLEHRNPVLRKMGLPTEEVLMFDLQQLCVPVMKNGVTPPDSVRWLVEHVDVACYDINSIGDFFPFDLHLTHLNPVLREMGFKEQKIVAYRPEQLCVPVMKNDKIPPEDALEIVQWIDFEKYAVDPIGSSPPIPLKLRHLNPLFRKNNAFKVKMLENQSLAVPVKKQHVPPPIVDYLDLTCHKVDGELRPPVEELTIRHLNPVLQDLGFKEEKIELHEMNQLCVPVAKNQVKPPSPVYEYIEWIDLACYQARSSTSQQADLFLEHRNPVLRKMGLPTEEVLMFDLQQLCVPVMKNGVKPPDSVLWLVEHVDVACYDIDSIGEFFPFDLYLTHLNPVLQDLGFKEQKIVAYRPEQLCVPVMKNDKIPPEDALEIVQWIDFEKYAVDPGENTPFIPLKLRHLNPLFQKNNAFEVKILENQALAVPVKKNLKPPFVGWD